MQISLQMENEIWWISIYWVSVPLILIVTRFGIPGDGFYSDAADSKNDDEEHSSIGGDGSHVAFPPHCSSPDSPELPNGLKNLIFFLFYPVWLWHDDCLGTIDWFDSSYQSTYHMNVLPASRGPDRMQIHYNYIRQEYDK